MSEVIDILNFAMVIFFIALFSAICVVVLFSRKKLQFKSDEQLQKLAKGFSVVPLIINLCLVALFFAVGILGDSDIVLILVFAGLFPLCVSAVISPSLGLLGLYFSICNTERAGKKGIKYIVASSVDMIISLVFTVLFFGTLILETLTYYGIV